ncbi:MAG: universal stress protein [Pseudomonadota bacterium]
MNSSSFALDRLQAAQGARHRKFVVVVDDSPECALAIRFAAGRAAHTIGGRVMLFYVLPRVDFMHWMAVEDVMRDEAWTQAEALMTHLAECIYQHVGLYSEVQIREGDAAEQLLEVLRRDPDVFALILGASAEGKSPGPLVDYFSGEIAGSLPCPVVIVPGSLSQERIDAMV